MNELLKKIIRREAHVVVVGLGYAGLPLVHGFLRAGFRVTGYDIDAARLQELARGHGLSGGVSIEQLAPFLLEERLRLTGDAAVLSAADVAIVCVPTPLSKSREPDLSHLEAALKDLVQHEKRPRLIVLESTTYPGTTREVFVPALTARGARLGEEVLVAFSPERVDPGNREFGLANTPKVLAGATPKCLEVARALYESVVEQVVAVSSTDTAEMVKLLENTFRAVNVALANEMAQSARRLGLDPFEIVDAAATKPFGYMPFRPGPGLGGHCLPIDPLYLQWKLNDLSSDSAFIRLADEINRSMPGYVVSRLGAVLGRPLSGANILLYGVAYKANVPDVRETPARDVWLQLASAGAEVSYMDPHVSSFMGPSGTAAARPADCSFSDFDAVIVLTDHTELPAERLAREARCILDTRGILRALAMTGAHIHTL